MKEKFSLKKFLAELIAAANHNIVYGTKPNGALESDVASHTPQRIPTPEDFGIAAKMMGSSPVEPQPVSYQEGAAMSVMRSIAAAQRRNDGNR